METEKRDEQLVSQYLAGDEKSLEILIRRYLKPIHNFAYRHTGNARDAEDATQETFLRVWRNLKKFDRQKKFKTWIFTIARNVSINLLRKKHGTVPFSKFENDERGNPFLETLADVSPLPDELSERNGLAAALARAVEALSPKYRKVVLLRHGDNFTFREIGESLGEPLHTVKSRYRRAVIMLKKALSNSWGSY